MRSESSRTPIVPLAEAVRTDDRARTRLRSRRARIVIAVLVAGVLWASLPFLGGLLGAVVLAVSLAPLQARLAPRIGARPAGPLATRKRMFTPLPSSTSPIRTRAKLRSSNR